MFKLLIVVCASFFIVWFSLSMVPALGKHLFVASGINFTGSLVIFIVSLLVGMKAMHSK